jgi:hypothetical protein
MENQNTNTMENKVMEVINKLNMENFHKYSWGRFQGSQGAYNEKAMINDGVYSQAAWNFIQENMEEAYQEFYHDYMQDYIIPACVKEIQEEEGCTELEAYEWAMECADDLQSTYWSIQHLFAETVYEIWEETPVEVEYIKHIVTEEGRLIANYKVTAHGITDVYWKEFAQSPEPEAGKHHYELIEGSISEALSDAYSNIELTHEEEVMMGWAVA